MTANTTQATANLSKVDAQAAKTSKGLGGMAKNVVKAAAAFGAFKVAQSAVHTTEDLAKSTIRLTQVMGMDVKTASEWSAVAKVRGVDAKQLGMAFTTLSKQQLALSEGSKTAAKSFSELGLSQAEVKGADIETLILKTSDAFKNLGPGVNKAALAQRLFGRGAQALGPFLTSGSDAIQKQLDLANKYGASFGGKTLKSEKDLIAATRELKFAQLGMQIFISEKLVPALVAMASVALKIVNFFRQNAGAATALKTALVILAAAWVGVKIAALQASVATTVATGGLNLIIPVIAAFAAGIAVLYEKSAAFRRGTEIWWGIIKKTVVAVVDVILTVFDKWLGAYQALFEAMSHIPIIGKKFKVVADAIGAAREKVRGLKDAVDNLNGSKVTVTVQVNALLDQFQAGTIPRLVKGKIPSVVTNGTTVPRKALGGLVVGGSGSGDKVPLQAMVEPGEQLFVLNKNASAALDFLQGVNSAVPRFASGGNLSLAHPGAQLRSTVGGMGKSAAAQWLRAHPAGPSGGTGGGVRSATGLVPQVLRALAWARKHGWHGSVTSGFRSMAEQTYLWNNASALGLIRGKTVAAPGSSSHNFGQAVDVSDIAGFARAMAMAPAGTRLFELAGDPVHFSVSGHQRGGLLGYAAGGAVKRSALQQNALDMMLRVWGAAKSFYPGAKGFPKTRFPGYSPLAGTLFNPGGGRGGREIIWPDWLLRPTKRDPNNNALKETMIHEWAHYFQSPSTISSTWRAEGGAQAFTRAHAAQIFAAAGVPFGGVAGSKYDTYMGYVRKVRGRLGAKWIDRGQFVGKQKGGLVARLASGGLLGTAKLAQQVLPKRYQQIMTAIAMAESGGRDAARGGPNRNGTYDFGRWQINSSHGYSAASMRNGLRNAQAARAILGSQGLGAWSTYNSGAYKAFMARAGKALGQVAGKGKKGRPPKKPGQLVTGLSGIQDLLNYFDLSVSAGTMDQASADMYKKAILKAAIAHPSRYKLSKTDALTLRGTRNDIFNAEDAAKIAANPPLDQGGATAADDALAANTAALQAVAANMAALRDEAKRSNDFATSTSQAQYATLAKAVAAVANGQIGGKVGLGFALPSSMGRVATL